MQTQEPKGQTPTAPPARSDEPCAELDLQKRGYEAKIARLEWDLDHARKEAERLLASRNALAQALNTTHLNITKRAHRIERRGGGLVGLSRVMAAFFLKLRKRT
jgi:hypothetical protein